VESLQIKKAFMSHYIIFDTILTIDNSGKMEKGPIFDSPWAIDYYNNELYVAGKESLFILNMKLEIKNSWKLPNVTSYFRELR